jgi:hypothetical protein
LPEKKRSNRFCSTRDEDCQKSFIAIILSILFGGGGEDSTLYGAVAAYILTEIDLGTGGGHFESIDYPLKVEAALPHS